MAFVRPHTTRTLSLLFIPVFLVVCAGLVLGLTYAPCYGSMCVEQISPYQARVHIAAYYSLLASITLLLTARTFSNTLRRLCDTCISNTRLPLIDTRLSIGGALLTIWIAAVAFGSVGYWIKAEYMWWEVRGAVVGFSASLMHRVAWTGITGHWIDIWIGLVMLPVSRNSILGRAFGLHISQMLLFHKLLAYALFCGSLVHGVLYYTFVGAVKSTPAASQQFPIDNPTMNVAEANRRLPRAYLVLPTGVLAFVLILAVVVTSLPALRRKNYNVFYFFHVISAIVILILSCIHASTNFYFLLPGIILWVGDWIWRLNRSLRKLQEVSVEHAGSGWFRIRLPLHTSIANLEKGPSIDSTHTPLATYHINFPSISKLEVHPFTAAATASTNAGAVLLFREAPERKTKKKSDKEWTRHVASMADTAVEKSLSLRARIEGPYYAVVPELYTSDHVLLIVGGSGITGALSIANWWASRNESDSSLSKSLRLVWTVRSFEVTQVYEAQQLMAGMATTENMQFVVHDSSQAGRIDCVSELEKTTSRAEGDQTTWVYGSGPEGLLRSVEDACHSQQAKRGATAKSAKQHKVSWYVARWTV